jgi:hypothetical protein
MSYALTQLLASIIVENPWWLRKETRYIAIRHGRNCKAIGIKGECSCSPEVRLMHDATEEQRLQGAVLSSDISTDTGDMST